ncbi:MAG: adenosine kinase [Pseudobdellovibrionaceae bacterium]
MDDTKYGLLAVGNAIVDVLAKTDDAFIGSQRVKGMEKGAMSLIDAARAEELYALMGQTTEMSGGSAGNTMAVYAALGGTGAYIGKVGNDQLGEVFRHDLTAQGITFPENISTTDTPTARCLILVTPDAERTMNTYLGACVELTPKDIDDELVRSAQVTYLEGYLFDPPLAKEAFYKTASIVKVSGRKLALSLSDAFCVNRHKDDFLDLVNNHVDILFANEEEIMALYGGDYASACQKAADKCEIVCATQGASGSIIYVNGKTYPIQPVKPRELIDTTGAGDAYAAGFLYGYTEGFEYEECGALASACASTVISQIGPRPMGSLTHLLSGEAA